MGDIFQAVRLNEVDIYNSAINDLDINCLNGYHQNLLHEAIGSNNMLLGLDLISRGINVNQQDYNGQTSLHFAAEWRSYELAKAIIDAGGDPNIKDVHQNNALWTAVFNAWDRYEIVELYKKAGADPHSKNKANSSPLDFALKINDKNLIAILDCG